MEQGKKRRLNQIFTYCYKDNEGYKWIKDGERIEVEKIYPSLEEKLVFEKDGKFGIIDLKRKKIEKNFFIEIEENLKRYIIVKDKNKYGILDTENLKEEVEYSYDYLLRVDTDIFIGGTLERGEYSIIYKKDFFKTQEIYEKVEKAGEYILAYSQDKVDIFTLKMRKIKSVKIDEIIYLDKKIIFLKK